MRPVQALTSPVGACTVSSRAVSVLPTRTGRQAVSIRVVGALPWGTGTLASGGCGLQATLFAGVSMFCPEFGAICDVLVL